MPRSSNGQTASPWCWTNWQQQAVLVALAGAVTTAALSRRLIHLAPQHLWRSEAYADPVYELADGQTHEEIRDTFFTMWGTGEYEHLVDPDMPWNEEIRSTWARFERLAASPTDRCGHVAACGRDGCAGSASHQSVPTLVVQHADDPIVTPSKGRYLGDHIPGAKYVELPGRNMYHIVEPWRDSFQEVAEFLTGHQADVVDDRVLATVLFTDIVGSTDMAAELGDSNWRALLDAHDAVVRTRAGPLSGPRGEHVRATASSRRSTDHSERSGAPWRSEKR